MMEYKRLTNQEWSENIDLTQELGYSYIYKRLHELEDKIEQGTLIELPIPYGTELHFLWSREHADKPQPPRVHSTKEWIFKVRDDGKMWLSSNDIPCGYYGEYLHKLGKTVFLTREEAEKRLEELQNG